MLDIPPSPRDRPAEASLCSMHNTTDAIKSHLHSGLDLAIDPGNPIPDLTRHYFKLFRSVALLHSLQLVLSFFDRLRFLNHGLISNFCHISRASALYNHILLKLILKCD